MTDYKQVKPENPERQYTITNARAPPIEQIIQQSIHDDEHIDNVVFKILKLGGVDKDYLQNRIQESGYEEEQRILQRAVQVWERRLKIKSILDEGVNTENLNPTQDKLAKIIENELISNTPYQSLSARVLYIFDEPENYAKVLHCLYKYAPRDSDLHILDIGCGGGLLLHILRACGYDGTGLDINRELVEKGREHSGLNLIQGDIFGPPQELLSKKSPVTISCYVLDALKSDMGLSELNTIGRGINTESLKAFFYATAMLTEKGGYSIHVSDLITWGEIEENEDDEIYRVNGSFEIISKNTSGTGPFYVALKRTNQIPEYYSH